MKKYLSLLLAIICCLGCFVACGSEEPAENPSAATLADAAEYIKTLYKSDKAETPRDYDKPGKVLIAGTTFTVTWEVSLDTIKVKESSMKDFWTIDLPDSNPTATPYKLIAVIKDADGKTQKVEFDRILPIIDNAGVATDLENGAAYSMFMMQMNTGKVLYAIGETDSDKFIKTTEKLEEAIAITAEKVEGGYKFYATINGAKSYLYAHTEPKDDGKVSKFLSYSADQSSVWSYQQKINAWVTTIDGTDYAMGTYGTFATFGISEATYFTEANTGVSQFPSEFLKEGAAAPVVPVAPTMTPEEIVDAAYKLAEDAALVGMQTLTGVITEVNSPYDAGYGNITVTIVVANKTDKPIECFRLSGTGADVIKVGDTITVTGTLKNYKGKVEFEKPTLDSYKSEGGAVEPPKTGEENQPTTETAVIPVVGTAYRMFFVQKNVDNKTFYLTGVLKGYYADTSTENADGADFYIEATDGGYHLTCTVAGAKKYANVVKSGTHINIKFDDIAKTVWTINETLKTVETELNEDTYILGTKADGTYTTLGPMSVDSGCMYAQFTANVVAPSTDEPATEEAPATNGGNTPVEGVTEIEVGTLYYINGACTEGAFYFDGTVTNGRINGAMSKDDAVAIQLEAGDAAGEYYIYFMDGETKTYIAAPGSKTAAFDLITEKNETAVWLISTADKGIVSKYMGTRGIGTRSNTSYTNFSTYATSNFGTDDYVTCWFVAAE